MTTETPANHYINNAQLYDAIVRWRESGDERISDELGAMVMLLSKKLVNHRNFNRYSDTVKEEMQTEALIAIPRAIPKFDYKQYKNPFAYFTQCGFNVMIATISKFYKNQATEISYFLHNTEVIDTTDQGTLTRILQHDAYVGSQARKKALKDEENRIRKLQEAGPTLFDIDKMSKEFVDESEAE